MALAPFEPVTSDGRRLAAMPECLVRSLYLKTYADGRFIHDAFFRMSQTERNSVDKWLVDVAHPLAFEAGTQESRIVALVKEFGE